MIKTLSGISVRSLLVSALTVAISGCAMTQITQPSARAPDKVLTRAELAVNSTNTQAVSIEPIAVPDLAKKPVPVIDLWQRTLSGFQLETDIENRRIKVQRDWYAGHQEYLNRVSARAERYLFHVVESLENRGMPTELALLPIVESAFDPFAYSHGRASGMWQFIPGTGRRFGLAQNWWYDGRRDVVASTQAALDYLDYLHKEFDGDWLLALAAYNSGEGNVRKAVRKNQSKGKALDFWSLDLPKETRAYVPKLIALAQLLEQPNKYGINFPAIANRPYFAQVATESQIDLAQAATLADISLEELYQLNPGFNQWATAPDGPHQLSVPWEKASLFASNLAALPAENRVKWIRYTIRRGDSLSTIALRHRTTAKALRQINQLSGNTIRAGKVLFIPVASQGAEHYALSATQRLLAKQQAPGSKGLNKQVHTVKSGDSFWELSRRYGVGVRELARWNSMGTTDRLKIGQKLVIWTKPTAVASTTPATTREIIRQVGYRVRPGDSLARIAQKFNVSIDNIEAWNGINRNKYLQPGQSLTLYVDVTRASL